MKHIVKLPNIILSNAQISKHDAPTIKMCVSRCNNKYPDINEAICIYNLVLLLQFAINIILCK